MRAGGQAAGRLISQLAPAQMQAALSAARALAPGQAAVQVRLVRQTYYSMAPGGLANEFVEEP